MSSPPNLPSVSLGASSPNNEKLPLTFSKCFHNLLSTPKITTFNLVVGT